MHGAPRSANVWLGLFAFNIITFIIFLFQFYSDRKSRLGLNWTGQQSQQQIETSFQQQNNETDWFYPSQDKYQSYRSLQDAGEAETSALLKLMPFDSVIIWIKPKRRSATIGSHSALLCGRVGGSQLAPTYSVFLFFFYVCTPSGFCVVWIEPFADPADRKSSEYVEMLSVVFAKDRREKKKSKVKIE